jgi:hypothetical protein
VLGEANDCRFECSKVVAAVGPARIEVSKLLQRSRGPGDVGFRGPNGPSATQTKDRQVLCTVLNGEKKVVGVFM